MKNFISKRTNRFPFKKRQKRCFQLLEVMVAVFLILLCAIPALQIFTNIYKEQAEVVRINQRDHLAHLIHAKLVELLYKRTIALEEIWEGKQGSFTDPDLQPQLKKLSYDASYAFAVLEPKKLETQQQSDKYLVRLTIKMKDSSKKKISEQSPPLETHYDYLLYIDRGAKDKNRGDDPNSPKETDKPQNGQKPLAQPGQPMPPNSPGQAAQPIHVPAAKGAP
ncbi:hypothetical protein [Candidatus Protochlamydia phocaeensis]|uniref:hypothetical protein n=1 Tax=Candidatus Protochlamydia phocaeensis TaxID=1414722 RepID=UPI000839687F|nr:hypothetical protein [Candidatus Protochlamydia phocaeensis]